MLLFCLSTETLSPVSRLLPHGVPQEVPADEVWAN